MTTASRDAVAAETAATPAALKGPRLNSVDLLRGVVMVLMMLDHTRDFTTNAQFNATDLTRTDVATFLTRWVTHFCAPTFMFLAGAGAYLTRARGLSKPALARFLFTRGLWLIFLELTVCRVGMTFSLDYHGFALITLWAIGWSMIALAALVALPTWAVGAFGVAMIALHNLADGIDTERFGSWRPLWLILHQPGMLTIGDRLTVFVGYPLIPWVGVMAAGYAFGPLLLRGHQARRSALVRLGLGLTLAFVVVRALNVYGDPQPWSVQRSAVFTVLSFLDCAKYPPSLLFLLMTLGPAIALLGVLDRPSGPIGRALITFGRVPLFFYLLQWPLAHGAPLLVAAARGLPLGPYLAGGFFDIPEGYGYSLPVVYLFWAANVAILYPVCRWFADVKQRRRDIGWLSYL